MSITFQGGRALLLSLLAMLALTGAGAAEAIKPTVAVLSLVGDEMTLVTRRMGTGSRLERNERESLPIEDPTFDVAAAVAAERAIKEALPSADRLRMTVRDKRLYELQERVFEPGPASDGMRQALQTLLLDAKATHLMLITKRRDTAQFRLANTHIGDGRIEGIGIFIDNTAVLDDPTTRQTGQGYFACYAYVKATLVDVATMRVLGASNGADSVVTTAIGVSATSAWDRLSAAGKVENLIRVADRAVYAAAREAAVIR